MTGKKRKEIKTHSVCSNLVFWLKYYFKNAPLVLFVKLVIVVFTPCLNMVSLYFPKVAMGLVERQVTLRTLILVLGGYGLLFILIKGLMHGLTNYNNFVARMENQRLVFLLFVKSLKIDYAYTESEKGRNAYLRAYNAQCNGPNEQMMSTVMNTVAGILSFVLYSTVLSTLSVGMVGILLLLSAVSYFVKMRDIRFWNSVRGERAENQRHYNYVRSAMGNVDAAKDIRIFNMGGWLRDRMESVLMDIRKLSKRERFWAWKISSLNGLIGAVRNIGAYAYLIYMAVNKGMSASDFFLYFSAIGGFAGFVEGIVSSVSMLRRLADDTDHVRNYLEYPEEEINLGKRQVSELSRPISIEFRDVSFSYRKGKEGEGSVFSHFNLKIHPGEKLALVGVNGAGKTTLVKLLCGFYEPDEGQILFNGIDVKEFSKAELYGLFSVVFQDVFMPPFKVDESIVLKETEKIDQNRFRDALERAGLKDIFKETGTDGLFGRGGIELSGGQRQRLLLARALYKDGEVLILDEPTAALDPIAESEVYGAYMDCCQNKTSIFISHRLASTSFSNRIVLLEKGKVLEMGTHEELMAKNGAYAEMYRIQSSYYKEGTEEKNNVCEELYTEKIGEGGI